jgi:hypothetical protein
MENQSPASNEAGDYLIPLFFESYGVAPIQLPLPELLERLDERVRASAGRTPGVTLISALPAFAKPRCFATLPGILTPCVSTGAGRQYCVLVARFATRHDLLSKSRTVR